MTDENWQTLFIKQAIEFKISDGIIYEIIDCNETNGHNNYYIVQDNKMNRKYVVMHIVKGKFAIYDYEYHDVLKKWAWFPCNGAASSMLRQEHLDIFPDLPYELNKMVYMHLIIKEYCMKNIKDNDKQVLNHINERRRDNRRENMIWVSKNQQRALLKKIGKLAKPPVEIRSQMPLLPKFCKWINAKKAFWIDSHPACFLAVENRQQGHKYIESMKGKKHTVQEKFDDFLKKYETLMAKPFGGQPSFPAYLEYLDMLEKTNKEIVTFVSAKAIKSMFEENVVEYIDHDKASDKESDTESESELELETKQKTRKVKPKSKSK